MMMIIEPKPLSTDRQHEIETGLAIKGFAQDIIIELLAGVKELEKENAQLRAELEATKVARDVQQQCATMADRRLDKQREMYKELEQFNKDLSKMYREVKEELRVRIDRDIRRSGSPI